MPRWISRGAAAILLFAGLLATSGCVDRAWLAEAKDKYEVKYRLKKEVVAQTATGLDGKSNRVHPPYRDRECDKCHIAEKGSALKGEGAEFCFLCHKREDFQRSRLHGPIAAGDCSTCHSSHESPHPNHTTAAVPALCFKCHDAEWWGRDGIDKTFTVHRPAGEGKCPDCHDPHGGSERFFLKASSPDLCFKCHDKGKYGEGAVHGPLAVGQCLYCHPPHAARGERLLKVGDVAELCFQCHTPPLAKHGPEQRDCIACHNPHQVAKPTPAGVR